MAYSSKTVEGGNREYVPFAVRQHPLGEPPLHAPSPLTPPRCCLQAIKAFRAKLEAKRFPIGPSIGIKDPVVTDGIADEVDYIWYDQEHSTMVRPPLLQPTTAHSLTPCCSQSPDQLQNHIFAAHGRGVPVIVRVPGPNVGYPASPGVTQPWGVSAALHDDHPVPRRRC